MKKNNLLLKISLFLLMFSVQIIAVEIQYNNSKAIENSAEMKWYHDKINLEDAWSITKGDPSITVAVIDSGINFSHPELSHAQWINTNEIANNSIDDDNNGYVDDVYGWDFIGEDNDPTPNYPYVHKNNHGTFIAGLIAAKDDGLGVVGIAPNVKIMNLQIWYYYQDNSDAKVWADREVVGDAIEYAVANGADVISCSFAGEKTIFLKLEDVDYYDEMEAAVEQGVVMVASAGNDESDKKNFPACFDFVLGIGATDFDDNLASYSSYGKWVDFVAPGGDNDDGIETHRLNSTRLDGTYIFGHGTSYSTPIVAGVIALMKSVDPTLTPDIVKKILERTVIDLGSSGKDKYFGYGLIDAAAAVEMVQMASTMNFAPGYTFLPTFGALSIMFVLAIIRKRKKKIK